MKIKESVLLMMPNTVCIEVYMGYPARGFQCHSPWITIDGATFRYIGKGLTEAAAWKDIHKGLIYDMARKLEI